MKFSISYAGFAETAAIDPRGNLTASGLAPHYLAVDSYPGQVSPWFIVIAEGDDLPRPELVGLSTLVELQVTGPEGEALLYVKQPQPIAGQPIKGLPSRLMLLAQLPTPVAKPGNYEYKLAVFLPESDEPVLTVSKALRVVDPSQLKPATSE